MPWRPAAAGARPGTLFATPERRLLALQSMWPHVVGPAVALNSVPTELRGEVLVVRVRDVRWRRALHRMHRDIIVRLRSRGAGLAPARLGFLEGGLPPLEARAEVTAPRPEPAAPDVVVDAASSSIADPEIRALFLRTAGRYLENTRAARAARRPGGDDHA